LFKEPITLFGLPVSGLGDHIPDVAAVLHLFNAELIPVDTLKAPAGRRGNVLEWDLPYSIITRQVDEIRRPAVAGITDEALVPCAVR
jgi:hypothetical protein